MVGSHEMCPKQQVIINKSNKFHSVKLPNKALNEKLKEERRIVRKNKQKRPIRDAATTPELRAAFDFIQNSEFKAFSKARDRVSILLLYLFGFRASTLRLITVGHLNEVLNNDSLTLFLAKSKSIKRCFFPKTSITKQLIKENRKSFLLLMKGEKYDDPVITSEGSTIPLSRSYLTERLNLILKEAGKTCGKTLSSHSFRIGFTTAVIEQAGLDIAQKVVGHVNIATTAVYTRRQINESDLQRIMHQLR